MTYSTSISIEGRDMAVEPEQEPTPREKELAEMGWSRRFTAGEPKLGEYVKMYQDLGFEVHLEPISPQEMQGECSSCFLAACHEYKIIYTRPQG